MVAVCHPHFVAKRNFPSNFGLSLPQVLRNPHGCKCNPLTSYVGLVGGPRIGVTSWSLNRLVAKTGAKTGAKKTALTLLVLGAYEGG